MREVKFLVVGSGVSGASAMFALRDYDAVLVDSHGVTTVGHDETPSQEQSSSTLPPKLRAPSMRPYFSEGGVSFSNLRGESTVLPVPNIRGGYSRFWGGGLFPYTELDFEELSDWPLAENDFSPSYKALLDEIIFSGGDEANRSDLGVSGSPGSQPLPLSPVSKSLLSKLGRSSSRLSLGRAVVALDNRPASAEKYQFKGQEFFAPNQSAVFSAIHLLSRIDATKMLDGWKLVDFEETSRGVEVTLEDVAGGRQSIRCKKLLLAMGTAATTEMVLRKNPGDGDKTSFVEHSPFFLPVIDLKLIGEKLDAQTYPAELSGFFTAPNGARALLTFYSFLTAPVSLLAEELGLGERDMEKILPGVLPALGVAQVWQSVKWDGISSASLRKGKFVIDSNYVLSNKLVRAVAREFRRLGMISFTQLGKQAEPGVGFHWAGTLPMTLSPKPFQTDVLGRLWNSQRIHVVDGSVLPSLSAKNHSLVMMANAHRIASSLL